MELELEKIENHPLFKALQNGYIRTKGFIGKFGKFRKAILAWQVALTNLLTRENDQEKRRILSQNLLDELGNGHFKNAHLTTFHKFIRFLDTSDEGPTFVKTNKFTNLKKFINMLMEVTMGGPLSNAYTFMGQIEKMYVTISTLICQYASDNPSKVPHYYEHSLLDIQHSNDLFNLADVCKPEVISQANNLFYHLFDDFCP
jgi:pyrroloquinoline-quinone synthase